MSMLAVLGGGSWGTALAVVLAPRFDKVQLWVRRPELARTMEESRENPDYLPGILLPPQVSVTAELCHVMAGANMLLSVVPSHSVRGIFTQLKSFIASDLPIISASKGLETETFLRVSQIIEEVTLARRVAVLSGPSFAREAAVGHPTAVVVATQDAALADLVQGSFSGPGFRIYTSSDPIGVELGGAYKNVVAIGAGVCAGLGLGSNAVAALITRGLAEMTRLAVIMGGQPQTLSGLAGLGDLVLTCTGSQSRNRQVGIHLAEGKSIQEIAGSMKMVAEGVVTTSAIVQLGRIHGVDLPIATQMEAVLHSGRPPRTAIRLLMARALRTE